MSDGYDLAAATSAVRLPPGGGPVDELGRRLRATRASQVRVRRQRWLWDNRIVLGGLTLFAGREGLGKSTVAADLAAQTTTGTLDGEYKGEPRSVVYLHSEDARDTTIVPRLIAAGADLDRVVFVDAVHTDEDGEFEGTVVLPTDVGDLADLAIEHDAALVVLDAATSVIDGRLDGSKDREMRKGLEAISRRLAERADVAVLGIVHFGKRDSNDTGKLILGSIAWSQVARSVLAIAADDDGGLVVSATKQNLAPGEGASLSARIVSRTVDVEDGQTSVGRVEWTGETDQRAQDLLGDDSGDSADRSEVDIAAEWLEDYLAVDPKPSKDVKKAAKAEGIAERTLQRALAKAGVKADSRGFPRTSWWSIPASGASGASRAPGAREPGATGATDDDLHKHTGPPGATGPVTPLHMHGGTDGATEPTPLFRHTSTPT